MLGWVFLHIPFSEGWESAVERIIAIYLPADAYTKGEFQFHVRCPSLCCIVPPDAEVACFESKPREATKNPRNQICPNVQIMFVQTS